MRELNDIILDDIIGKVDFKPDPYAPPIWTKNLVEIRGVVYRKEYYEHLGDRLKEIQLVFSDNSRLILHYRVG